MNTRVTYKATFKRYVVDYYDGALKFSDGHETVCAQTKYGQSLKIEVAGDDLIVSIVTAPGNKPA